MQAHATPDNPSSIRGERIGAASDTANRTFADGRVCAADGCQTVLSVYNASEHCWQHEKPRPYFVRVPRKRRDDAA